MKILTLFKLTILFLIIKTAANGQNIMISNQNLPNETSIMIDPKHPNVLIAGANIENYYISLDTGNTWSSHTLNSTYGVWGDPVIAVDTSSNFYFFHLSNPGVGNWIDRIVCQKTSDNGSTWSNGSYAGLNGTKAQDKQWCAVDRSNNNMYITWTQFDNYGSFNSMDSSIILFSKSLDAGLTWSNPIRINKVAGNCVDSDNTVEGAVPTIGPNGEIYVSWAGPTGLGFNKSLDQGNTWLSDEILVSTIPGGWDYTISGIDRCNGLPITTCDLSNGPNHGTIYINWSDQRNGASNTDVWLAKSIDNGQTWSPPIKVNDDNSNKQQFLTWMSIDQISGYLYFVFYDRRNYSSDSTDVYVAISMDGGNSFVNRKISESPFFPDAGIFFGDYTNIVAYNGIIRPIWTRLNNGLLSVWTDITTLNDILNSNINENPKSDELISFENSPNPSSDYTFVSFKLKAKSNVSLTLYDLNGKIISKIINNENRNLGKYLERINLQELSIKNGTYILKLDIDNRTKSTRQIVLK